MRVCISRYIQPAAEVTPFLPGGQSPVRRFNRNNRRTKLKPIRFIDLFCGGGGSVTGAINVFQSAGMAYEGRGFNHWDTAVRTLAANHPEIVPDFGRACTPVEGIVPNEIFDCDPERLDYLWASPSCTHHSVAAGGQPRSNQLRSQPEHLLPFLRLTKCRRMYVENVPELLSWGPLLDADTTFRGVRYRAGQPDPRHRGAFFNLWIREIQASGYRVEWQILNSADYGAHTSRERLIVQAVRKSSGERIVWPEPTHTREPAALFRDLPAWRPASEIIDWSIPGKSIVDRERPLCDNPLRRIEAGVRKYWGAWAEPFLIVLRGTKENQIPFTAVPLTRPLPTITAAGMGNIALVRPLWLDLSHTRNGGVSGSTDSPLNTITCTHGTHAVVAPFLTRYNGGEERNHGVEMPIPVIDTRNRYGLVEPLFVPQQSAGVVRGGVLPTIATAGAIGMVEPLIVKYFGNGSGAKCADVPLDTITTKDHFGLVQGRVLTLPDGRQYKLDITHRMLTMRELADATGFPHGYQFCGGDTAAKKQIGNAVPPALAEALYRAALAA